MTAKDAFTDEELERVRRAPMVAGKYERTKSPNGRRLTVYRPSPRVRAQMAVGRPVGEGKP
jgi:hypothetical protein